ncbi:hypothetical protein [Dyadobacter sp. CY326]|uniref:hypothetical protein n=1 Tax=Dyadobacter sp. CY326 TaxID=2907300 RepID=UPI001F20DD8C|nr:hypothetical protein [Dyadobacter sp. CY326]MCE7065509.1 hypothetical protein [Dyadobacter sp. CY326]
MKFTPFYPCCALFLFSNVIMSCSKKQDEAIPLSGHYVNETFLETAKDSIPGTINTYCYDVDFVSADSVKVFYGFEEAMLAYAKSGKKYAIKKALQDKDLLFSIDENQRLVLEDSAWKQSKENSVFAKNNASAAGEWHFPEQLNATMIARSYEIFEKGKATGKKVVFDANGKVTGLNDFTMYELCFSGDCVGEVHPISNNITFTSPSNSGTTYAFQFNKEKKILNIYNIEAPIQDIKGERGIKDVAFELHY